jgi:hypothetical protein
MHTIKIENKMKNLFLSLYVATLSGCALAGVEGPEAQQRALEGLGQISQSIGSGLEAYGEAQQTSCAPVYPPVQNWPRSTYYSGSIGGRPFYGYSTEY